MNGLKRSFKAVLAMILLIAVPYSAMGDSKKDKTAATSSPLSTDIGGFNLTFGGDLDGMFVFRNSDTSSGLATNFNNVPFNNTIAYYGTETRLSAQDSKFSLSATDHFDDNNIKAYMETDFLGNSANNLYVTTNSATLRLRQYWMDLKKGNLEFTVGQAYSLLTPGRKGISPENGDIFVTQNLDESFQVGLAWTRAMQFRVVYHADSDLSFGFSLENPDQYVSNEVTFPNVYSAQFGGEADNGANPNGDNLFPDVIGKVALDAGNVHVEAAGFVREFNMSYLQDVQIGFPSIDAGPFSNLEATGLGGELNTVIGLSDGFRLVGTSFYGYGGGRYLGGLGPDFVVLVSNGPVFTPSLSPVVGFGGIAGFEADITPGTQLAGYFGFDEFDNNNALDWTSTALTKPYIGFGGWNSANSNTRYIREFTVDFHKDIWNSKDHGAMQWGAQYSYVDRFPWFVAAGAPGYAAANMFFTDVKYILP